MSLRQRKSQKPRQFGIGRFPPFLFQLRNALQPCRWRGQLRVALRPLEEEVEKRLEVEKELERSRDDLDIRVQKRTAELSETNTRLQKEIEERQKTARDLYDAKEEWERTFDAIGDMVTIQDADMNLVKVNKTTCEEFNLPPEELVGKRCYDLFHDRDEPCEGCREVLSDKSSKSTVFEVYHPKLNKTLIIYIMKVWKNMRILIITNRECGKLNW